MRLVRAIGPAVECTLIVRDNDSSWRWRWQKVSSSSSSWCSWRIRRVSYSLILKMKLVPPSLPRSSYVPSSFWFTKLTPRRIRIAITLHTHIERVPDSNHDLEVGLLDWEISCYFVHYLQTNSGIATALHHDCFLEWSQHNKSFPVDLF
jgi:hypothetical protein